MSQPANSLVIFGASGDLTSRKLIPALYRLYQKDRLPEGTHIVGVSRSQFSSEDWRAALGEAASGFLGNAFDQSQWDQFAQRVHYSPGDVTEDGGFQTLKELLDRLEDGKPATRVYYLSTAPKLYVPAIEQLGRAGLAEESRGARRIVIEKPVGRNLKTAHALNEALHRVFQENQIFRIDHYLGKETVQNILTFRFANAIFEPIWNLKYIDHVQITVAEKGGIGHRSGYYDQAGVLRDMFQNHLLQLLTLTAMEPPVKWEADALRDEKVKVLQAVRDAGNSIRGQYRGYTEVEGIPPDSETATFAALSLYVDNWRWHNVPFYLLSGKKLASKSTAITIQFKQVPHLLFPLENRQEIPANTVSLCIQPKEEINLCIQTKKPKAGMQTRTIKIDYEYASHYEPGSLPDAYERLLLDALQGDASLFNRADEIELAWKIYDPILEKWSGEQAPRLHVYEPESWGPEQAHELIRRAGSEWRFGCE